MWKFRIPLSISTLVSISLILPSCKDDEPPVKPKLSFSEASRTVNEADGVIQVEVKLDKPYSDKVVIDYTLGGTALDDVAAGSTKSPDYGIVGEHGEVEIAKGETTGIIELELYSDVTIENDEVIEISLDKVSTEGIELTRDDEMNITLKQEDGVIINLSWPLPTATKQADMDLLLRIGTSPTAWSGLLAVSWAENVNPSEEVFLPKAITDSYLGLSYTYYDGTMDTLKFKVIFADFTAGTVEPQSGFQTYEATYTAANKNKWYDNTKPDFGVSTTKVVQTFQKTGGGFANFSAITVPSTGSREIMQNQVPSDIRRGDPLNLKLPRQWVLH